MAKGEYKNPRPCILDTVPDDVRQEIISKRFVKGESFESISQWLEKNKGIIVSHTSVKSWIDKRSNVASSIVYGSSEFREKVAKDYSEVFSVMPKVFKIAYKRIKDISDGQGPTAEMALMMEKIAELAKFMESTLGKTGTAKSIESSVDDIIDKEIKLKRISPVAKHEEIEEKPITQDSV